MTASQPWSSSQRASATDVADDMTVAPAARTRSTSGATGSPKWKLTTSGRSSSTTWHRVSSKAMRPATGAELRSTPSSS